MIRRSDLNFRNYPESPEQNLNLNTLFERLQKLCDMGAPIEHCNSGLRNMADQMHINPKAPKSKHLIGAAADIADPKGELRKWVRANMDKLEKVELWIESLDHTPTWVHFQIFPPKSGRREFIP